MTKEREISAIDAIYQILDELDTLKKRSCVIEDNVKILSNKLTKVLRSAPVEVGSAVAAAAPAKINSPQNSSSQQKVEKLLLGKVKVFGYIVNKEKKPLSDVAVKIFDEKNDIVKDNKTNSDGYWDVRLPPGRYGVEYIHKNFKPINRTIVLANSDSEYEVR